MKPRSHTPDFDGRPQLSPPEESWFNDVTQRDRRLNFRGIKVEIQAGNGLLLPVQDRVKLRPEAIIQRRLALDTDESSGQGDQPHLYAAQYAALDRQILRICSLKDCVHLLKLRGLEFQAAPGKHLRQCGPAGLDDPSRGWT